MINWMKSQTSRSGSPAAIKVEPGATYTLFENHWVQAVEVMQNSEDSEGALIVISHLSQMISFLAMTRGESSTSEKSCKGFWLQHRCSDEVIRWLHNLQVNKGIQMPEEDELKLVAMLHSLCEAASRDGELLGYAKSSDFIQNGHNNWDGAYALASLLLEYSLRNTVALSETARYSFIQLIQLAGKFPGLERNLSQENGLGLTNVVVSGLSACFAQLPTFTRASSAQLIPFIEQLKFVDDVTHAAPQTVSITIAKCFSKNFLLAVIEPAMTQDEDEGSLYKPNEHDLSYVTSLNEEIGIVTFYLEVVCWNITHPRLVKSLIHFVNKRLLNILIYRLSANESVSVLVATLSLFIALLEFYCEDFWVETILKYLTPQQHLMISQRHIRLPHTDFYESSTQFLSLIPMIVCEVLGAETIEENFIQYVNHASMRWSHFDATIGTSLSITRSTDFEGSNSSQRTNMHVNPIFPSWKHNYNGADRVPNEKEEKLYEQESMDTQDDLKEKVDKNVNLSTDVNQSSSDISNSNPLNSFTTINLQQKESVEDLTAEQTAAQEPILHKAQNGNNDEKKISTSTNHGYEENTLREMDSSMTVASFGPFLDNLLVQLSNWPHLDLHVILMLTEIISILASCRIPLINSLLLDPKLTLQPYYLTFHTLLKRIREDLEYQLHNVSPEVIASVWETMNFNVDDMSSRKSSAGFSMNALALSPSYQLGDTLRKTIGGVGAEAIANVWKRFNRKSSSSSTTPKVQVQVHPSSGTVLKVTDAQSLRNNEPKSEPQDPARIMAMKIIFFSHWVMELAGIAQQLCWNPAYE